MYVNIEKFNFVAYTVFNFELLYYSDFFILSSTVRVLISHENFCVNFVLLI